MGCGPCVARWQSGAPAPDPLAQLHAAVTDRHPGWGDTLTLGSWWVQTVDLGGGMVLAYRVTSRFELGGYLNVGFAVYRQGHGHCGQGTADGAAFFAQRQPVAGPPEWVQDDLAGDVPAGQQ